MKGFEFLKNNGAQRVRNYDPQPFLLDDGAQETESSDEQKELAYECSLINGTSAMSLTVCHQRIGLGVHCALSMAKISDVP